MQIVTDQMRDVVELRRAVLLRDQRTHRRQLHDKSQLELAERQFEMQLQQVPAPRERDF